MDQLREKKGQLTIFLTPRKSAKIAERVANVEPFFEKSGRVRETDARKKKERKKKREWDGRFDAHAMVVHYTFSCSLRNY